MTTRSRPTGSFLYRCAFDRRGCRRPVLAIYNLRSALVGLVIGRNAPTGRPNEFAAVGRPEPRRKRPCATIDRGVLADPVVARCGFAVTGAFTPAAIPRRADTRRRAVPATGKSLRPNFVPASLLEGSPGSRHAPGTESRRPSTCCRKAAGLAPCANPAKNIAKPETPHGNSGT